MYSEQWWAVDLRAFSKISSRKVTNERFTNTYANQCTQTIDFRVDGENSVENNVHREHAREQNTTLEARNGAEDWTADPCSN